MLVTHPSPETTQALMTTRPRPLQPVEIQVLQAVNRFGYLTAEQLNRLFWPKNTRDGFRHAQRRLALLVKDGYLLRLTNLPRPGKGTAPYVHAVHWRGRKFLRDLGEPVPGYYRPSETDEAVKNPLFM